MLHLVRSHRLDRLADALADVLRTPAGDPLAPDWVVVGSRPAERWLMAGLAERLGICAHVRFLSPSTLLEEVVGATLGVGHDVTRAGRPERLGWRILAALPALLDDPALGDACAPVRGYLRPADAPLVPGSARAVAFAGRVAECFARYALAAPELVRAWDAGEGDDWQAHLWRALHAGGAPHLAALAHDAESRLRADGRPAALPSRLAWLAEPPAAPLHVRTLVALAAAGVDVHALVPAPSRRETWDDAAAHPLLRSLGRPAADLARVLADACDALGVVPARVDAFDDVPAAPTLLAALQRDLLDGAAPMRAPLAPRAVHADDASLRVHACHGPMRQVEVLRDELLRLLDDDATLRPRDVLVLTPDVATFAPLVEAAFAGGGGVPTLPVRVADRPARRVNPAADVALRVLALAAGRVDAVAVLDLLAVPTVGARFGIGERAHDTLRRWVRESGVRWGVDGDDRAATHALPGDDEHTWRFGLERLLLGWALPGDGRVLFGGALPFDEIEGGDAELLGRLAEACTRLFDAVRAVRGSHPIPEWRRIVLAVVDALVDDAPELVVARRDLRGALDALVEEAAPFDAPVEAAAVRALLDARFAESAGAGGAAGAVTLAALRGGRVLPARVVALLGVDEATFPRPRAGVGFDLLARDARPGALDPNADDRLRVLEALHAARERLVVVYHGRTVDTNEPVAPAVPIAELLDAIDAGFVRADGARGDDGVPLPAHGVVARHHPLQPFSPRAFAAGDGRDACSHDRVHLAGARALRGARVQAPRFLARALHDADDGAPRIVDVDELARWVQNPARALLGERLRVRLDEPDALDVADPIELDELAKWRLSDDVLARLLDGEDATPLHALQRAAGWLPHGPLGALAFDDARVAALDVLRPALAVRPPARRDAVHVDRVVGAWRLVGRVGPRWGDGLCEVRAGRVRARHLAALWVRHLALHLAPECADVQVTSRLVGRADDKGRNVWVLAHEPQAEARLAELLALHARGRREPVAYVPECAFAYADAFTDARTPEDAHREGLGGAQKAWHGGFVAGERDEPYVARLFGDEDLTAHPEFPELARGVFAPLRARLTALQV